MKLEDVVRFLNSHLAEMVLKSSCSPHCRCPVFRPIDRRPPSLLSRIQTCVYNRCSPACRGCNGTGLRSNDCELRPCPNQVTHRATCSLAY